MKYKCEYCNKVFETEGECLVHEVESHDTIQKYRNDIYEILDTLNWRHNTNHTIDCLDIKIHDEENCGFIWLSFDVNIKLKDKEINIHTSEDNLLYDVEQHMNEIFLKDINEIEGKLKYEGWCGGDGADDYIINDTYLKDFLRGKEGKKIKIIIK